jgi:hypothetical protein
MYQASIPAFVFALNNLAAILKKAEAHADNKKIDANVLLQARLYPDMFALTRQVQIACDIVKGGAARLAGAEVPSFPDTEASFEELQARIQKTIAFIQTLPAAQIEGSEAKTITLKVGGNDLSFTAQNYLLRFVNPNLYFHSAIAYGILRHNGVDVGKMDFLGPII